MVTHCKTTSYYFKSGEILPHLVSWPPGGSRKLQINRNKIEKMGSYVLNLKNVYSTAAMWLFYQVYKRENWNKN